MMMPRLNRLALILKRGLCTVVVLMGFMLPIQAHAENVQASYRGLILNAKTNSDLSALAGQQVLLILHGTMAHNGMEIIEGLLAALADNEQTALAVTLSLGVDNRSGMYPCAARHQHRHEDALGELAFWLDWLSEQGVTDVVLVGHSRGSVQIADYLTHGSDQRVKAAVLIAPPSKALAKPSQLVSLAGGDLALEPFLHCRKATVSAASYASYYSAEREPLAAIAALSLPVALLLGSNDNIVPAESWLSVRASLASNVSMKIIDGADHFFRDLYTDEIVDYVNAWLELDR